MYKFEWSWTMKYMISYKPRFNNKGRYLRF